MRSSSFFVRLRSNAVDLTDNLLTDWTVDGNRSLLEWTGSPADKWNGNLEPITSNAKFVLGRAGSNRRMKADLHSRVFTMPETSQGLKVNFTLTSKIAPFERCLFDFQLRTDSEGIEWNKKHVMKYDGKWVTEKLSYDIPKSYVFSKVFALNLNFMCNNQHASDDNTAIITNFRSQFY
jgi:hypothetical protein